MKAVQQRVSLDIVAMLDQHGTAELGRPKIQYVATGESLRRVVVKAAGRQHADFFLFIVPEVKDCPIMRRDLRGEIAQKVQGSCQVHLEAAQHAQTQDDVQLRRALANGLSAKLGEDLDNEFLRRE